MAARHFNHDPYGRPLPTLVPMPQESHYGRPANESQRQRIAAILTAYYDTLLRRDVTAEMHLSIRIVDGIIQDDIAVGINCQYRPYQGA
jgi:hypothetical protein